ncbi:hypothetical protein F4803DRAFT_565403 [Xylaria telfairii]|nr:hypothetical protein F4803DRAFT_565403 [Xylaria telfairii]
MPKRLHDAPTTDGVDATSPPAKTERSHEENQERAYIAASRRADRSLEARVQSARMASAIHRKRTGRGLRVTEEIVRKEEMYEEMEDERPRNYGHLAAFRDVEHPGVDAMIMAQMAKITPENYEEVNRRFRAAFPYASTPLPLNQNLLDACGANYHPPPISFNMPGPGGSSISNNRSVAAQPHSLKIEVTDNYLLGASPAPTPYLSPATTSSDATEPTSPSYRIPQPLVPNLQLCPQQTQQLSCSFHFDLPKEIEVTANAHMSDPMVVPSYGGTESDAQSTISNGYLHGHEAPISDHEVPPTLAENFVSDNFTGRDGSDGWDPFESWVDLNVEE